MSSLRETALRLPPQGPPTRPWRTCSSTLPSRSSGRGGAWAKPSIRDTSCRCHPLTGVTFAFRTTQGRLCPCPVQRAPIVDHCVSSAGPRGPGSAAGLPAEPLRSLGTGHHRQATRPKFAPKYCPLGARGLSWANFVFCAGTSHLRRAGRRCRGTMAADGWHQRW